MNGMLKPKQTRNEAEWNMVNIFIGRKKERERETLEPELERATWQPTQANRNADGALSGQLAADCQSTQTDSWLHKWIKDNRNLFQDEMRNRERERESDWIGMAPPANSQILQVNSHFLFSDVL